MWHAWFYYVQGYQFHILWTIANSYNPTYKRQIWDYGPFPTIVIGYIYIPKQYFDISDMWHAWFYYVSGISSISFGLLLILITQPRKGKFGTMDHCLLY